MGDMLPYTYIACQCTNISQVEEDEEDQTFDPFSPRANYALYPLEHLLYCNECHELRCPRCYFQESMYYYCPNCLFETTTSAVKTETNRCTRSCFQCPICIAPLAVNSVAAAETKLSADKTSSLEGPFILSCPYCYWTTLEIGITFEKNVNISGQLAKIQNGGEPIPLVGKPLAASEEEAPYAKAKPTDRFSLLADFYKTQNSETMRNAPSNIRDSLGLDSPSQLSRLISTYGIGGLKRPKGPVPVMREVENETEGLAIASSGALAADEEELIEQICELGWDASTSRAQRTLQTFEGVTDSRSPSELRPIPVLLRSKRATRCRNCRNYLAKPDDKRHSTKYKIRLLAQNYVPQVTISLFDSAAPSATSSITPAPIPALKPLKPVQFLLTLRNPLFETVKITLATPTTTPGPIESKVTLLCPEFELGANTDAWDAALDAATGADRKSTLLRSGDAAQLPEAGKVWERGRNWTSVIIEFVPGERRQGTDEQPVAANSRSEDHYENEVGENALGDLKEPPQQLEVPVFLRMEYETDETSLGASSTDAGDQGKGSRRVKRELAYWVVLGLGMLEVS